MIGARLWFFAALIVAGFSAGLWLMWGQVTDARANAAAANSKADEAAIRVDGWIKTVDDIKERQRQMDEVIATRSEQDNKMQAQLYQLRADLKGVYESDPISKAWATEPIPSFVAERLWGPPSTPAPGTTDNSRAAAGKPAANSRRTSPSKPN